MLILSRKKGQRIIIETPGGELITVVLYDLKRDAARVGVVAPGGWPVDREEVRAAKQLDGTLRPLHAAAARGGAA